MANYNRQILIPYLRDVCSIEMMCEKLKREVDEWEAEINRLSAVRELKPNKEGQLFYGVLAILAVLLGLFLSKVFSGAFCLILGCLVATFFIGISIFLRLCDMEQRNRKYKEVVEACKRKFATISQFEKQVPEHGILLREMKEYSSILRERLDKARKLKEDLYDVNIIPKNYRNIYASYYLYDYFNTSRETDLDKIIQTLLLEEIKQQLDKIIWQNESILLNQRAQLAMQEKTNESIAEKHRVEMKRIADLERNQELQLDYQQMIAKNQRVTNFFLEADYWDKRR